MFCFRIFVSFSLSVFPLSPPSPSLCCHGAPPLDAQINLPSVSHCLMLPSLCCCDDEVMCILLSLSLGHFFPSQSRLVVTCSRVFILRPPLVYFLFLLILFSLLFLLLLRGWEERERDAVCPLFSLSHPPHTFIRRVAFYPASLFRTFLPAFLFRSVSLTRLALLLLLFLPTRQTLRESCTAHRRSEVRLFVKVAFCARWLRMSPIRSVFN